MVIKASCNDWLVLDGNHRLVALSYLYYYDLKTYVRITSDIKIHLVSIKSPVVNVLCPGFMFRYRFAREIGKYPIITFIKGAFGFFKKD